MRWILFILFCLLGAPAHAVSIPGVTTTTTTDSTTEPAPESDIEQKYAIYHRRLCFRWEPVKEPELHFKRSTIKRSIRYMFAKPITNVLFTLFLLD